MNDQFFSDALTDITVASGTVRLDFATLSATEQENGKPKLVFAQRIVMSIDGFMRATGKIQETLQTLHKLGIIQVRPVEPSSASLQKNEVPAAGTTEEKVDTPKKSRPTFP